MKNYLHKIRINLLLAVVFLSLTGVANGQTLKAFIKAADEAFDRKDYFSALMHYQSALEFQENDINIAWRVAESARNMDSYVLASRYYDFVATNDKSRNYPDAVYYSGLMNTYLANYDKAKENFESYVTEFGEDNARSRFASAKINDFSKIKEIVERPDDLLDPQPLGGGINTSFSEFNPIIYKENIYYSSLRFPNKKDVFVPQRPLTRILKAEGESAGIPVDEFDIEGFHTSHISINDKGTKAYFTMCEYLNGKDIRCDIYSAEIIDNKFSDFKKLPEPINNGGNFTSTQPSWSKMDGKEYLLFASNREGGKGGLDIYQVEIVEDSYRNLKALDAINTEWNEATPFYSVAKDEIYFSSQGHSSIGGYDIFKAKRDVEGNFVRIFQLDAPINTSFNELYYFLTEDGNTGYFASNRNSAVYLDNDAEACCNDLFKVEIPNIEINLLATTFNAQNGNPLNYSFITLVDDSGEFEPIVINTEAGNEGLFKLERRKNYTLIGHKPGFKPDSLRFDTYDIKEPTNIEKKLYLTPDIFILDVYTFYKPTGNPLNSSKITIVDMDDPENTLVLQMEPFSNNVKRQLDRGRKYMVVASKIGYKSDTLIFDSNDVQGEIFVANLYLGKGDLEDFIPLAVYFDNDHPSPRTTSVRTPLTYAQTYPSYLKKWDEFVDTYTSPLSGQDKVDVTSEFDYFFQLTLPEGNDLLALFITTLEEEMLKGQKVTITVQGFTSPLASDVYNLNLSKRRINSMVNQMNRYNNGALRKYFNNGQLKIEEKAVGERMSPKNISDVVSDRRNSVFSLPASRERRAEVIQIERR